MSHVVIGGAKITDLDALRAGAARCGLEMSDRKTYRWYGKHVGDYEMPEGFTAADLGKCDHVLSVKGQPNAYEVGVVRRADGTYTLIWDFWGSQGRILQQAIGEKAAELERHYTIVHHTRTAQRLGWRAVETIEQGVPVVTLTR